ncbi:MAG: radical SAM protein [Victivallales bacterium]|nr:radical SAM protein [Victivallales bacterium]
MKSAAWIRIATGCTGKVQRKLLRFAWNGRKTIRAFKKRQKRHEPFFPAFLMLSITNRCNLKCQGCWVEQTREPQQLSMQQIQAIIDTAAEYDSRFFGILGGEPLLHADLFNIFSDNPHAYFQLFTNGTMLNEPICSRLAALGNVTPVISIEGLEEESEIRRGHKDVFTRSLSGLQAAVKAGLFTGVAASINKRNFDQLVDEKYLHYIISEGVHYIWYYIYRPCGADPAPENALTEEQIVRLRQFIVDQRVKARIIIVDAYWDAQGRAVCPGAMGISHHIAPNGAVEFCPVIQFTGAFLHRDAANLENIFQQDKFLEKLRHFSSQAGRGCVLMDSPGELEAFMRQEKALDSSNRDAYDELKQRRPLLSHDIKEHEIPEKSWLYRLGKKYYFFGFGAYG